MNDRTMKILLLVILMLTSCHLQAQVYTSEVEVAANADSKVGIGTTSPTDLLSVNGKLALYWNDQISGFNTTDAHARISSTGQSGSYPFSIRGNLVLQPRPISSTDIVFATGQTPMSRLVVKGDGKVGIGTTAPKTLLTIGSNSDIVSTTGIALGTNHSSLEFVHSSYSHGYGSKFYAVDEGNGNTSLRLMVRGKTTSWSNALYVRASDNSSNTRIGIGTTSPSEKLHVNGTARASAHTTSSDARLKKNIQDLTDQSIDKLRPVSYQLKADDSYHFGVIAQDIKKVYPHMVSSANDEMMAVNYQEIIPLLVKEVQDLKKLVRWQEAKIEALEAANTTDESKKNKRTSLTTK